MLRTYKTEVELSPTQYKKYKQTVGVCRFVYNLFIDVNKERYEHKELYDSNEVYLSAYSFSKWLNNEYLPNHPDKQWIKNVSSKAVKQAIVYADKAYKDFMKHKHGFPKFKKKYTNEPNVYLPRNSPTDFVSERHRIKVPTFGWIKLKEKGYIPQTSRGAVITSCTLVFKAGRVYIAVRVKEPEKFVPSATGNPIGADVGIKSLVTTSDNAVFANINYTSTVRKLNKQLARAQRSLSRQQADYKKGDTAQNIQKTKLRIQRIYQRLHNIREDYINKVINELVRTKPAYITIEDLNIRGMMKNRHLAKAVQDQCLGMFFNKFIAKCLANGIEVRKVSRWYPSSKTCHECGYLKQDLKLSERTYRCPACGNVIDRDLNAALNLRDAQAYAIVA